MCIVMDEFERPFGGKNIILAGDFAQLPPASHAPSLYSHRVTTTLHKTNSVNQQEATMGKFIWHMFTTVVILRQNMRQRLQSKMDAKFRTLLENLRYKSCTPEDCALLDSRITGATSDGSSIADPEFRNVSIIVSFNWQRDAINELKVKSFARDTNQELHTFYSIDSYPSSKRSNEDQLSRKLRKNLSNPVRANNNMDYRMQQVLWELAPENTRNLPSKLQICIGMPVMVRYKIATECGVTNGAEGIVVGWKSIPLYEDKSALETLFVKLTSLPTTIQIEGLPDNVVPIPAEKYTIQCKMPNEQSKTISRQQVYVIPNFAMTDFSSQGRTRPFN
ncbi:hypothetical protein BXZ70DRAFT_874286, partial [Cristinia sonorae]